MAETLDASTGHVRLGSNAGQPITRRDGHAKVTGAATFAADNHPQGMLFAVYASAAVARGRVTFLDVAAAKAHPGVVEVITPANRPALARDPDEKVHMFSWRTEALQNDAVRYAGQPVAVVVAETLEAAAEGARLLAPRYDVEPAHVTHDDGEVYDPPGVGIGAEPAFAKGDVEVGLRDAAHRIETAIETPLQYHNALEPHAIVAAWDGDRLTIDVPNQAINIARGDFAGYFGVPAQDVHLKSPFIGGGFGSKAILNGPQLLCILAARMVGRPVKLVLRRDQMFGPVGHRGGTRQRITLGIDAEGRLTALDHHAQSTTSRFDDFLEPAANASHNLYATPALRTGHTGVRIDTGTPGPMRAPGEATGSAALECAMDEAAEAAGLDPLAFRLLNYAETDPATGRPFSSKELRRCYLEGASRFGWAGRPLAPRQMRSQSGALVGWGMGTALFPAPMFQAQASATLREDGTAVVEISAVEMGQGALTALAQIAADGLGLDADKVELRAGDSELPDGGVAGGSGHTATAGSAIFAAGGEAIARLAEIATADPASPLFGAGNQGVVGRGGRLQHADDETRSESYAEIMRRAGVNQVEGAGTGARNPADAEDYAMFTHGAVFAEVMVDPDLCQVRVSRLVGAFAAGRIINPRLARSQLTGGMIWGLSFALHEAAVHDPRTGRPMNADFAGYHVPVNADVPSIEALLVDEVDPHVNALGVKGVGEVGITGTVGAIANAIWHATGVRARRFPIRIEELLR
ncbi:xanthine dehydrogenase family protein molybdopterin-binding subunit [Acuticoccus sp. I52.16.1]|uniref:xanthine dehydrogenase family protein molybdopterin-binding subunit n=1 Tax=Acuticoccus sp. I52.16.1 TaxID=2928472 RepID=UPI001FD37366|nr:xanthine dehydrogenase family protein molybdopterin-binding subunit [Acuticoccus sp. I52.16.1]UOM34098.1 xanthine dehydrogenase family protein molybdopterin-binding subunit [Acuticoccus sp. I52.16.1]